MQNFRNLFLLLALACGAVPATAAQISIHITIPVYPELVVVPGYPVYYAPRLAANYFFYDGMYWVYQDDEWYASSWYNGPWEYVDPEYVPLYVLRVPVRYYRRQPDYFRAWRADAPPRWDEHWGREWEQHRSGWDQWNHRAAPAPAPLPDYQRQYTNDRYPQHVEQQQKLEKQNYHYQPRDPATRQYVQEQALPKSQRPEPKTTQERARSESRDAEQKNNDQRQRASDQRANEPRTSEPRTANPRGNGQQNSQRPHDDLAAPRAPTPAPRGRDEAQRPAPTEQRQPEVQERSSRPAERDPREQNAPKSQGREDRPQNNDAAREHPQRDSNPPQEQERGRNRNE